MQIPTLKSNCESERNIIIINSREKRTICSLILKLEPTIVLIYNSIFSTEISKKETRSLDPLNRPAKSIVKIEPQIKWCHVESYKLQRVVLRWYSVYHLKLDVYDETGAAYVPNVA